MRRYEQRYPGRREKDRRPTFEALTRPADEVEREKTVYLFPQKEAEAKKDRDYPWVGETFELNGKEFSVIHMNHPKNPKDTLYSAYRDYGRFGAFFERDIKSGAAMSIRYRFLVCAGAMPETKVIQEQWDAFAGVLTPSPLPRLIPTRSGDPMVSAVGENGSAHLVRLFSYLPGVVLAEVNPRPLGLLRGLGRTLGLIDQGHCGPGPVDRQGKFRSGRPSYGWPETKIFIGLFQLHLHPTPA